MERATATLRVKRAGTTAGVLDEWQVIDPLLVPVIVENNQAWLRPASLDGTPVPVSGPSIDGWPKRRFYVYPGVYELRGHKSRYLTATPETVVAVAHGYDEHPPAGDDEQLVGVRWLRCTTRGAASSPRSSPTGSPTTSPRASPPCPRCCPTVPGTRGSRRTLQLTRQPDQPTFARDYLENLTDDELESTWNFWADNGSYSYIDEDGERQTRSFTAHGSIVLTPDDDLTVIFKRSHL